jgi:hypothetical protein
VPGRPDLSVLDRLSAPGAARSTVTHTTAPQLDPSSVQPSGAGAEEGGVQAGVEASEGLFQWTKPWYPLEVVAHLDATKPQHAPHCTACLEAHRRSQQLIEAAPLLGLAAWGLQRFSGLFHAYGFEHAQND